MAEAELVEALYRSARSFRLGMDAQANEAFVELVDRLAGFLGAPLAEETRDAIASLLPRVVAAQTRGDTIAVADMLEHELVALLGLE